MIRVTPNTRWTPEQAMKVAHLMLDPRTGGLDVRALTDTPLDVMADRLAQLVPLYPAPMTLAEDAGRALHISADPYDPEGQAYLHFSNEGFCAAEVRDHLEAFMTAHAARQWVAVGIRPGLFRLICRPLGFDLVRTSGPAFVAVKGGA